MNEDTETKKNQEEMRHQKEERDEMAKKYKTKN